MSSEHALSDLEFAALVSSRICHDVISPVGAIANGLEILAEESDETMREHAFELVRKSAAQASAKLQFARLAFGAAGAAGAAIDLNDAQAVAHGIIDGDKHSLTWSGPAATMAKDKVKLLLNMVTIALTTLPRGGEIDVQISGEAELPTFTVRCKGPMARIPKGLGELFSGSNGEPLDAHSIQPFFAGRIAASAEMALEAATEGEETVILTARPIA